MKNSKLAKLAGLTFAVALIVSSIQPLQASAHNDNGKKSESNNKEKKEKVSKDYRCTPWGIFHAWGIDKRLENGKGLPAGIYKKLARCGHNHATTTNPTNPGVTAPKISDIRVSEATSTATISWKTNESTTSKLKYGTDSDMSSYDSTLSNGSLSLNHEMNLTGLTPNTKYYYVITVKDSDGNTKESSILNFRTDKVSTTPEQDVVAPQIMYVTIANLKATSTRLVWITNESSDSKVWISTNSSVDTSGTPTVSSSASVYYHDVTFDNLATSTKYYYTINSTDAAGNKGSLTGNFFQTLAE